MIKSWTDDAWEDFEYWVKNDKKKLKRILQIIKDIERNGKENQRRTWNIDWRMYRWKQGRMVMYKIYYTKRAIKDIEKLKNSKL